MAPRSLWASSHGEKASIPNTKIEPARFSIGKLLSAEHDLYDREWPFSVPTSNASLRGASIKSSSKAAAIGHAKVIPKGIAIQAPCALMILFKEVLGRNEDWIELAV